MSAERGESRLVVEEFVVITMMLMVRRYHTLQVLQHLGACHSEVTGDAVRISQRTSTRLDTLHRAVATISQRAAKFGVRLGGHRAGRAHCSAPDVLGYRGSDS